MAVDDEFDVLAASLPELSALDDGFSVDISQGETVVRVTRVQFDGWVRAVIEQLVVDPVNWHLPLDACRPYGGLVMRGVLRNAYNELALFVLEEADLDKLPMLLGVMHGMAVASREPIDSSAL